MPFTECLIQRKLELLLNCFYAFTSKEIWEIHAIGHTVKIHNQSNVNCILSMTPTDQTYGITLESNHRAT